jgi:hypothetical protein
MTTVWELNFIRATEEGDQKVMFTRTYEDGIVTRKDLTDEKVIFLNYVSLFPAKDIIRIKLGIAGHYTYTYYYLDKTHIDEGFLGVFGVSEYNTAEVYDWSEIEFISKLVFAEYYKRLMDGRIITIEGSQQYLEWLDSDIKDNFKEFKLARDKYYQDRSNEVKNNLLQAFQSIAACTEKKELQSSWRRNSEEAVNRLREISMKEAQRALDFVKLSKTDSKWMELHRRWEIQLINTYGNPLTEVLTFINGEHIAENSEERQNRQTLEGMTYSVLKSFVEQQKLTLINMKSRTPAGMEYILFKTVKVGDMSYLLILNVNNHDPQTSTNVDLLKGDEGEVLENIANELIEKKEQFFDTKSGNKAQKLDHEIESLIYRHCKAQFKKSN